MSGGGRQAKCDVCKVLFTPFNLLDIPEMMRAQDAPNGWNEGADLLDYWFNGEAFERPLNDADSLALANSVTPEPLPHPVRMDWVRTFERGRKVFEELTGPDEEGAPHKYLSAKVKEQFAKKLERDGKLTGVATTFGDLTRPVPELNLDYVQYASYGSGWRGKADRATRAIDGLDAALGNFTMRAVLQGRVEPFPDTNSATGTSYQVQVRKVGIFVHDLFDFHGEQDLGYWDKDDNSVTFALNYAGGTLVTNASFRHYRTHHQMGRDFLVYSDLHVINIPEDDEDHTFVHVPEPSTHELRLSLVSGDSETQVENLTDDQKMLDTVAAVKVVAEVVNTPGTTGPAPSGDWASDFHWSCTDGVADWSDLPAGEVELSPLGVGGDTKASQGTWKWPNQNEVQVRAKKIGQVTVSCQFESQTKSVVLVYPIPYALKKEDNDGKQKWGGEEFDFNGSHVEDLQRDLIKLGYWIDNAGGKELMVDGDYGGQTRAAVRLFQDEHKGALGGDTAVTGAMNKATRELIDSKLAGLAANDGWQRPGLTGPRGRFHQLPPGSFSAAKRATGERDYNHYGTSRERGTNYVNENWGTPALLDVLKNTVEAWKVKVAAGYEMFLIGDMSRRVGGYLSPHSTHRDGKHVDIDSHPLCSPNKAPFDKEKALELANAFVAAGAQAVFTTCKYVIDHNDKAYAVNGHHDHMHVQVIPRTYRRRPKMQCYGCREETFLACRDTAPEGATWPNLDRQGEMQFRGGVLYYSLTDPQGEWILVPLELAEDEAVRGDL